jgi:hypothetical protein
MPEARSLTDIPFDVPLTYTSIPALALEPNAGRA